MNKSEKKIKLIKNMTSNSKIFVLLDQKLIIIKIQTVKHLLKILQKDSINKVTEK